MNKENIKILFMGTPDIARTVLSSLLCNGFNVVGVISQPDRPVGRKHILLSTPVKMLANEHNIPVYQPIKIRKDYEFVKEINPDVIVVIAYGQILPQGLLDIPKYGCINLHGSLLPKYRGAAPIQYSLINNEKMTGMSLMEMTKDMDAGRVYATKEVKIDEEDNSTSLFKKMGEAASELIVNSLPDYIDGKLPGVPQDENAVTFAPMIKAEEEHINLEDDINHIFGLIRALSDEPGAYFFLDDIKIKIFKAKIISNDVTHKIGEIISADKFGFNIQFKGGVLSILELQKEGKNRIDYKSFINGNNLLLGKVIK